jgi:magnesium transporter
MPVGTPHEQGDAMPTPVGFVLSPELLVTVRYRELRSFLNARDSIADHGPANSAKTFATLLEAMVDVEADVE